MSNRVLTTEEAMGLLVAERNQAVAASNVDGAKAGVYAANLNLQNCEAELEKAKLEFEATRLRFNIVGEFTINTKTGELIPVEEKEETPPEE